MKFHFISIRAMDPASGEDALNKFLSSHSIASIEKQFVSAGANSFWSICIEYVEGAGRVTAKKEISENIAVKGYLRYMDDMVRWCSDKTTGKQIWDEVTWVHRLDFKSYTCSEALTPQPPSLKRKGEKKAQKSPSPFRGGVGEGALMAGFNTESVSYFIFYEQNRLSQAQQGWMTLLTSPIEISLNRRNDQGFSACW